MCAKTSLSLFSRWGQNYPRIELDSTDIFEIHVIHILLIMMVFGNYVHFILLLLFVISLFFLILREWWQVFTSSKNSPEWFSKFAPQCPRRKRQKSKNLAINRTRKTQIGRSDQHEQNIYDSHYPGQASIPRGQIDTRFRRAKLGWKRWKWR